MTTTEIKGILRSGLKNIERSGKHIDVECKSKSAGELVEVALRNLAKPGWIKNLKNKGKNLTVTFYDVNSSHEFYSMVTTLINISQPMPKAMKLNQNTVSHNENGTNLFDRLGNFGNWLGNLANGGLNYLNNKTDSAEAVAIAQAEAAQAAAEAEKKTALYIGLGAGALVLVLVLILALRK